MFVSAESGTTTVRLNGRFDALQARTLDELLSTFGPVRHVIIDFKHVRESEDAAVANLARTLAGLRGSRVTLLGLTRHLRRILRYVGIDAENALRLRRRQQGHTPAELNASLPDPGEPREDPIPAPG